MNKTAIKNYAIWARVQLIESAKQRAYEYEITENGENNPNLETIGGRLLSKTEKEQRQQLINQIRQKGYTQVMEEAAYTWFNRFIALRFMEVNGYLPSKVRVFTDENNAFKPEILKEAMSIELEGLDRSLVLDLLDKQDNETLYKTLLIAQCNALNTPLPYMFERISNWTELLFPANLLRQDSVIGTMISSIPEEDWHDQVQIIGWLYQYYNSEPFQLLYDGEKATAKINKEELPAATQLFTPDWIVRYMVENSLGRLWVEGHPDETLQSTWKYYLPEAEQEPQVQARLAAIHKEYANIKPEDIRCIDPCMGSGHILCYLFDVLVQIYEAYGYSTREAAQSIVENNLYGLDIDDRAAQLAYFAVMMKARQYDRRFFARGIQPHVMAIQESNTLEAFDHLQAQLSLDTLCLETANQLIRTFRDAKEYGSILDVEISGLDTADRLMKQIRAINGDFELMEWIAEAEELLPLLVKQAAVMQQKYDVVVTNPPYLNANRMSGELIRYIKQHYPESKQDLFTVMYQASNELFVKKGGYISFITPTTWMHSEKFKKIRELIIDRNQISTLVDCGTELFDGKVGHLYISAFITRHIAPYAKGQYVNVSPFCYSKRDDKEPQFFEKVNRGFFDQRKLALLPDKPLAYDMSQEIFTYFENGVFLENAGNSRQGLTTSDNNRFVRLWHEVVFQDISFSCQSTRDTVGNVRWYPFLKGGAFQRWFQRFETVVNYVDDGQAIKESVMEKYTYLNNPGFVVKNTEWYFREGITWNDVAGERFNARYMPAGYIFADASPSFFPSRGNVWYYLAYFNSIVFQRFADVICQGLHYSTGQIPKIPIASNVPTDIQAAIEKIAQCNYTLVEHEMNRIETQIGFARESIIDISISSGCRLIEQAFLRHSTEMSQSFDSLKENEEELNRIFIDIYGLQDELTPEVEDKDVTVRRADLGRDIRSFISYAVGCMFGRYSLCVPGLLYAGGTWNDEAIRQQIWDGFGKHFASHDPMGDYEALMPDRDGILSICDDEYFGDDIVGRFVQFVETVFGKDTLEENLRFIAKALGGNGTPRQVIRSYFLNDFYADHLKIYQKRPIYWLFSSGKKNGFKCLIYMHRYQPDLLARIRTDYVHEQQERYRTQLTMLEDSLQTAGASERVKLNKQITKIKDQALELQKYEEKIHHLADQMIPIDLDDGVKVNYAKFQDVLEKIK